MSDEGADWRAVEQVRAGDDSAFAKLMERYKRPILNFVFRMVGDTAEAEDVAQDVFVRAYLSILKPEFRRTTGEFSTWLFQVARNAALDCLRRRARRPTQPLDTLEGGGGTLIRTGPTAADKAASHEIGEQIAAAVALLPEDQRTAIVLAEYEDLSTAQIAAIMNCSRKSVESRLYRARQFLRKQLVHLLD